MRIMDIDYGTEETVIVVKDTLAGTLKSKTYNKHEILTTEELFKHLANMVKNLSIDFVLIDT